MWDKTRSSLQGHFHLSSHTGNGDVWGRMWQFLMSFIQVFQVKVQIAECKHNGNCSWANSVSPSITNGHPQCTIDFTHISSKYLSSLYQVILGLWVATGFEYHFKFHNHHIVEMTEGNYRGWEQVDSGFMSIHLYGHPKFAQPSQEPCFQGQVTRTFWSRHAMHINMRNAHPLAKLGGYTNVTSVALWNMG